MLFAMQQQQIKKILPSTFCHHWRVLKECEDRWWMSLNDLHCMLCVCVKESTLEPLHGPYICLCGIAIDLLPHAVKLPCTCHHTKGWICLHFRWTLQYLTRWIANWKQMMPVHIICIQFVWRVCEFMSKVVLHSWTLWKLVMSTSSLVHLFLSTLLQTQEN